MEEKGKERKKEIIETMKRKTFNAVVCLIKYLEDKIKVVQVKNPMYSNHNC